MRQLRELYGKAFAHYLARKHHIPYAHIKLAQDLTTKRTTC